MAFSNHDNPSNIYAESVFLDIICQLPFVSGACSTAWHSYQ